ncbi:MAG: hypothetical protein GYB68_07600 [Chloroflexi bacterium]|nr:hypothetical protein [Chloroflexota bacterium]
MSEQRHSQTDSLLNYVDYLNLNSLLAAQTPVSDDADEMHFIIIHQVHELWFKLALEHMERARAAMQTGQISLAVRLIQQVTAMIKQTSAAVDHLKTLPPMAFHQFRILLSPGSGLQSYQFREIEFLGGYRPERHVEWVKRVMAKEAHWSKVARRLEEPSLAEAFDELVERQGAPDIAALYAAPNRWSDLYVLADSLSELDQSVVDWRYRHIQLVERTIGTGVIGTGGTDHGYLQMTLLARMFPKLWEARDRLTERVNQETNT